MGLDLAAIVKDIAKRPFILVGTGAAADAAAGRHLVQPRHQGPGRGALAAAAPRGLRRGRAGLLHFFWMRAGKNDFGEVAVYAAIVAVLLGWRIVRRLRPGRAGP
jgi:methionine sulfoxide reductase heme-binding subunit